METARKAICESLGRVEMELESTLPAQVDPAVRRLCDTQLPTARKMNCGELGVLSEAPGTLAHWYCTPSPAENPMAVPSAPPDASAREKARRTVCQGIATKEFELMQSRPAWGAPEARAFCDTSLPAADSWGCGEFGVGTGEPGTASHWYCARGAPVPAQAVPAPPAPTARAFVAPPPQPPPSTTPLPGQGMAQGAASQGAAAQAVPVPVPLPLPAPVQAVPSQQAFVAAASEAFQETMFNPRAAPPATYGPYVELANAETGVKAFCRMNLEHQVFVCDTPVHGAFSDGAGNALVCDRATWLCKPAAAAAAQ